MERAMLEFSHVTGKSRRFHLEDVSFALPAGYLMGLAGKNGAGKTTLLDYIMAPGQQYEGEILLDGVDIRENHTAALEQIGFVSERNHFLENCSAAENARLLGGLYRNFDVELFTNALKQMEMSAAGKSIEKLSRGERMRFQMAFALAHRPKIYLLDEATAGMDPVFRVDFFKILHRVIETEEASVLMATHIEEELELRMDYVGILEQGRMISFGEN